MAEPRSRSGPRHVYRVPEPAIYNRPAILYVGTRRQYTAWAKRSMDVCLPDPEREDTLGGSTIIIGGPGILDTTMMWLPPWDRDDWQRVMIALAHECLHAAVMCLHDSGVTLHYDAGESLAYLQSYYLDVFLTELRKDGRLP